MSEVITQTGTSEIKSFLVKGTFDDGMLSDFLTFHRECIAHGVKEAFVYIDSPGGAVHTFASMQALMRSGEVAYHTIVMGHACSAGCLLTAMGNFRWAIPETMFMFHDASSIAWGKQRDIKETVEWNEKWLERVFGIFAEQTKQPLEFWLEKAYSKSSGDLYFTAEEAKEWGMIDFIGVPLVERSPQFFVELPTDAETFAAESEFRSHKSSAGIDIYAEEEMEEEEPEPTPVKKKAKKVTKKTAKKSAKKKA